MVRESPFGRRTLAAIIIVGVLSFALAIGWAIFGDDLAVMPSAGSDSYSRSAVGHHGLVEILRRLGVPVVVSRHQSAARARGGALLVLIEPRLHGDDDLAVLRNADRALVVLPKWFGIPDPQKPAFVADAWFLALEQVQEVLAATGAKGEVFRLPATPDWKSTMDLGGKPDIALPQLIRPGDNVTPIISSSGGVLLASVKSGERELWVLSDPDLLSNHGLARGDNAVVTAALIDQLRKDGAVVFDETLHGHASAPSIWRELGTFPLSLAPASAFLTLLALLWAATGRYGAPVRAETGLRAGKLTLIDNTAELMRHGGHSAFALERYLQLTVLEVARQSHAPSHLAPADLPAWLARFETARRVSVPLATLSREVAGARPDAALAIARRVHRWRQEMSDGSR